MKEFGTAVCSGLFVHDANDVDFLADMLVRSKRVILLLDGANRSRSSHLHPFTVQERSELLSMIFPADVASENLKFIGLDIEPYNVAKQATAVRNALTRLGADWNEEGLVGIIPEGPRRLRIKRLLFCLRTVEVTPLKQAEIRTLYHHRHNAGPLNIQSWLRKWRRSEQYMALALEYAQCEDYRSSWRRSPYPPTFNAADAVIRGGEKILLIERAKFPFKGLAALPGGMIDPDEFLFTTALRESAEEAGLEPAELAPYFVRTRTFDEPYRDPRGRFISQTSLFELPSSTLELVAGDDAEKAWWEPIGNLTPSMFAFDHWNVVGDMLGLAWSEQDGCRFEKAD
jgi:ADP-ribose pyrophosphatase YjhB (NUDIX family)